MLRPPLTPTGTTTLFPYTTLFRSLVVVLGTPVPGARPVTDRSVQQHLPRSPSCLDCGRIDERFECRTRLAVRLVSAVELALRPVIPADHRSRSEEHTSELQSLMRYSYAVFCLKKKK